MNTGYTLADLERLRAESREAWDKIIRDRQIRLMEQMGPDVYFHVQEHPTATARLDSRRGGQQGGHQNQ